jgi:hypothetical protein
LNKDKQVKKVIGEEVEFYDTLGRKSGLLKEGLDYLDSTNIIYSGSNLFPDSTVRFLAYYDIVKNEPAVDVTHTHYLYNSNQELVRIKVFSHSDSLYKEIRFFPGEHGPDSAKIYFAMDSTFPYGMPNPEGEVHLYTTIVYHYNEHGLLVEDIACQETDDYCALTKYKYDKAGQLIEKQTKRGPKGNLLFTQKVTLTKYSYNKKGSKKLVKTRHAAGDPMSSIFTYYKLKYRCNGLIRKAITVYNTDKEKIRYQYEFY